MDIYLNFKKNARQAIQFYESVFNETCTDLMIYGDMPESNENPLPEGVSDLVLNASLSIKGTRVMFSDVPEELAPKVEMGNNVSLVIQAATKEEVHRLFQSLSQNGTVQMEPGPTFWSPLYAAVIDPFGIYWQINLEEQSET